MIESKTPKPLLPYHDKLNDPRWLRKKATILERDQYTCLHCHKQDRPLQVRHMVHRRCDPWCYPDELYITICDLCVKHRLPIIDALVDGVRLVANRIPTSRLDDLVEDTLRFVEERLNGR